MTKRAILIKRQARIIEVSLTSILEEQIDVPSTEFEPTNVIDAKCEAIADILGCSYEEAERIVLARQ